LIITEPGVAPAPASTEKVATIAGIGALGLLTSLSENSSAHGLNLEIKDQEDKVKKAEKEYKDAVSDGENLQDKLKKVQNDIEANRNKQQKQAQEITKQKELLLQVQARQKNVPTEKNN
jgi:peptidoglycan hydrolase CwlO-like protein